MRRLSQENGAPRRQGGLSDLFPGGGVDAAARKREVVMGAVTEMNPHSGDRRGVVFPALVSRCFSSLCRPAGTCICPEDVKVSRVHADGRLRTKEATHGRSEREGRGLGTLTCKGRLRKTPGLFADLSWKREPGSQEGAVPLPPRDGEDQPLSRHTLWVSGGGAMTPTLTALLCLATPALSGDPRAQDAQGSGGSAQGSGRISHRDLSSRAECGSSLCPGVPVPPPHCGDGQPLPAMGMGTQLWAEGGELGAVGLRAGGWGWECPCSVIPWNSPVTIWCQGTLGAQVFQLYSSEPTEPWDRHPHWSKGTRPSSPSHTWQSTTQGTPLDPLELVMTGERHSGVPASGSCPQEGGLLPGPCPSHSPALGGGPFSLGPTANPASQPCRALCDLRRERGFDRFILTKEGEDKPSGPGAPATAQWARPRPCSLWAPCPPAPGDVQMLRLLQEQPQVCSSLRVPSWPHISFEASLFIGVPAQMKPPRERVGATGPEDTECERQGGEALWEGPAPTIQGCLSPRCVWEALPLTPQGSLALPRFLPGSPRLALSADPAPASTEATGDTAPPPAHDSISDPEPLWSQLPGHCPIEKRPVAGSALHGPPAPARGPSCPLPPGARRLSRARAGSPGGAGGGGDGTARLCALLSALLLCPQPPSPLSPSLNPTGVAWFLTESRLRDLSGDLPPYHLLAGQRQGALQGRVTVVLPQDKGCVSPTPHSPPLCDSQEQLTPPTHHKQSTHKWWQEILSYGAGLRGSRPGKGAGALVDIQDGGVILIALTSVASLCAIPRLTPPGLHSGESHPNGRGCLDPGGPRDPAVSGSTRPWKSPMQPGGKHRGNDAPSSAVEPRNGLTCPGGDDAELPAETVEGGRGGGAGEGRGVLGRTFPHKPWCFPSPRAVTLSHCPGSSPPCRGAHATWQGCVRTLHTCGEGTAEIPIAGENPARSEQQQLVGRSRSGRSIWRASNKDVNKPRPAVYSLEGNVCMTMIHRAGIPCDGVVHTEQSHRERSCQARRPGARCSGVSHGRKVTKSVSQRGGE
ncbi:Leukocyte immunoglobulin-like receptor subfamily A member 6 [Camelus dromedarius]|uniref:Leukocyte immunoglobulin-like receptor subfamily A member 6 n=1 Tax=Camelus dromedarius TaxID=9838 RepID=A0A5N4DQE1_CAMDR|nr:Leukocyte immunoglobulin-like receptor subfamily A member 6 [Camelus dromedarius]